MEVVNAERRFIYSKRKRDPQTQTRVKAILTGGCKLVRRSPKDSERVTMIANNQVYTSCYSVRQLLERGWTQTMIQKLLGLPDATKPNPCYSSAPPMKFYIKERVESIEASAAFKPSVP